jgi:hypothetical protein
MRTITFPIALKGLASEFAEADQPPEYARKLINRFINLQGAAEKRPGLKSIPSPIDNGFTGNFDCFTEHVNKNGTTTLLASRINSAQRELFKYGTTAQAWVKVSGALYTSMDGNLSQKAYTVQHTDKTFFVASDLRSSYYISETDTIYPHNSVIESGKTTSGTTSTVVKDSTVSDWLSQTLVQVDDLFYNATKNAYGVVTSIGTGNIDVTAITSAAAGGTGIGLATNPMTAGDTYEIWDLLSLNIIPLSNNVNVFDNVAISTTGTSPTVVAVSGLPFNSTDIRQGDYLYNTTRAAATRVTSVSANVNVVSVSGQASGDSLVFLQSIIPICSYAHVHYGRMYMVNAREPNKILVSLDGDPTDFTTFRQTLAASSINYGGYQPQGEQILTLNTFNKFLVAGGKKNIYITQGINPIADTTAATTDLTPVGLFSQGCISKMSLANIGSDMLFIAQDGLRQFRLSDILAVNTNNVSEVIKTELRTALNSQTNSDNIQAIHYPRRNWVMLKVGDTIYNFNYTPTYTGGQFIGGGSWSKYTGRIAECQNFLLQSNGTLLAAYYNTSANSTTLYEFDTGAYDDNGTPIVTDYKTAWLNPDNDGATVKDGKYIRPYFENSSNQTYMITATADLESQLICDTVIVSAAGSSYIGNAAVSTAPVGGGKATNTGKYPLRWRGKEVEIEFITSAGNGSDTISKFILYTNEFGRE